MRRSFLLVAAVAAVVALSMVPSVEAVNGKCRALAMSGGGDKAAYEAGVLRGLLANLSPEEMAYDVVSGISAGSTLAAAFSIFNIGDEASVVKFALNIIASLSPSAIYTMWPGGLIEGLTKHSSLFDSTPLRNLFTTAFQGHTLVDDRITCMGASNLRTGLFERFCEHAGGVDELINATLASAAIPGVFIAQTFNGNTYVDGGTLVNVDVLGAISQCVKLGYAQTDIIVDTIECSGGSLDVLPNDPSTMTTLPILLRAAAMSSFANKERDFVAAQHAYPDVTFRYRIHPSQAIPGAGIDFNRTQMIWMEDLGTLDAKNAVFPPGMAKLAEF